MIDEVGDRGRVHGAAGARAHHQRDLGNDSRRECVAKKDVGVSAEADDALLDARAAGVGQADDRRSVLDREIHDLADLLGMRFGE